MIFGSTWPLKTLTVHFFAVKTSMADSRKGWCYRCDFIHNLSRCQMWLRISHTVHDLCKDPCIRFGISGNLNRLAYTLYTTLRIGEGTFLLCIRATRKDDICIFCGFCHKQLINNKEINCFKAFNHMMRIRICSYWIFSENK